MYMQLLSIAYLLYSPAIAESASQPSRVVHKSHFSEHVKAMHKERDSGFEQEYLVGLHATVLSLILYVPI